MRPDVVRALLICVQICSLVRGKTVNLGTKVNATAPPQNTTLKLATVSSTPTTLLVNSRTAQPTQTTPRILKKTTTVKVTIPAITITTAEITTVNPNSTTETTVVVSTTQTYATPHQRSLIEEKISHLACDLPALPSGSHLWMGNETHELLLPQYVSESIFL